MHKPFWTSDRQGRLPKSGAQIAFFSASKYGSERAPRNSAVPSESSFSLEDTEGWPHRIIINGEL